MQEFCVKADNTVRVDLGIRTEAVDTGNRFVIIKKGSNASTLTPIADANSSSSPVLMVALLQGNQMKVVKLVQVSLQQSYVIDHLNVS